MKAGRRGQSCSSRVGRWRELEPEYDGMFRQYDEGDVRSLRHYANNDNYSLADPTDILRTKHAKVQIGLFLHGSDGSAMTSFRVVDNYLTWLYKTCDASYIIVYTAN